jgi:hypothetical protein
MKAILRFRRWKLFSLMVVVPVGFQIINLGIISQQTPELILYEISIMAIIFIGVFFAWFFTLGTNLRNKNAAEKRLSPGV